MDYRTALIRFLKYKIDLGEKYFHLPGGRYKQEPSTFTEPESPELPEMEPVVKVYKKAAPVAKPKSSFIYEELSKYRVDLRDEEVIQNVVQVKQSLEDYGASKIEEAKENEDDAVNEEVTGYNEDESNNDEDGVSENSGINSGVTSVKTGEDDEFSKKELEVYHQSIKDCTLCPLHKTRNKFVFGMGNPNTDLVFVGEAPGQEEDRQGLPFVGWAGVLFDKILEAMELDRTQVYICNILKCRPPGNRDPLPEEVKLCKPYLVKQIDIIKPKIICALGRVAAQNLLDTKNSLAKLRGDVYFFNNIPVISTYHPAALLRNPHWKKPAWEDLKWLMKLLEDDALLKKYQPKEPKILNLDL